MINTTRPFLTLVRRELWEHRGLIWAPLAMALTIIVLSLLGAAQDITLPGVVVVRDADEQRDFLSTLMIGLLVPQLLAGLVVVFFYLLDGLFTERRDRSILFWKSLPVSDNKTVLSKLFVALVAMPLWIWALSLLVGLVVFGVLAAKVSNTPAAALGTWHGEDWLVLQATLLGKLAVKALWYLPVAGWLLLVSVLAKRAPFLWATLPFLVLSLAERIALGTNVMGALAAQRLFGFREEVSLMGEFPLLASTDLWIGVAIGAALVYAAIRVRQRSDDS